MSPDEPAPAPDPLSVRSPALVRAFGIYLRFWYLRRHFRSVRLAKASPPLPTGPLIVYGNHPSWWDPLLYILLADRVFPSRPSFGPMEAKALGRYGVLERMGVFGIDPDNARGAARFLSVGQRVLTDPRGILWVTAEGKFSDARLRPVRLRAGIAHLARRMPHATLLPLATEVTYWNESRPEALLRFGSPIAAAEEPGRSAQAWTARLETALMETMDDLAVASMARDPAPFRTLVRGGAGIGGIYDGWRRLESLAGGRPFDPSHEGWPGVRE